MGSAVDVGCPWGVSYVVKTLKKKTFYTFDIEEKGPDGKVSRVKE